MKLFLLFLIFGGAKHSMEAIKGDARAGTAKQDLQSLGIALELYKTIGGTYPTTEQGLAALFKKPNGPPRPRRWTQFVREMPVDPWGRGYQYKFKNKKFELWSTGPNLIDPADDLYFVPPKKEENPGL